MKLPNGRNTREPSELLHDAKIALVEMREARERDSAEALADDKAVEEFASAMKAKLARKRAEGSGGWNDPARCSPLYLAELLVEHVGKGDPVDIGNFAMMLYRRLGDAQIRAAIKADRAATRRAALEDAMNACHAVFSDEKWAPHVRNGANICTVAMLALMEEPTK